VGKGRKIKEGGRTEGSINLIVSSTFELSFLLFNCLFYFFDLCYSQNRSLLPYIGLFCHVIGLLFCAIQKVCWCLFPTQKCDLMKEREGGRERERVDKTLLSAFLDETFVLFVFHREVRPDGSRLRETQKKLK